MPESNSTGPQVDPQWQFRSDDAASPAPTITGPQGLPVAIQTPLSNPEILAPQSVAIPPTGSDGSITWTASEFIAHQKSARWYVYLGIAAVVIAVLILLLTKDKISAGVVILAAAALGAYAGREPRQLEYRLDARGLTIGTRYLAYEEFRSFSMMTEGAFTSITFVPLKRFAPLTTIYHAPEDQPKIINLLTMRLPFEERKLDVVDQLMNRIRF